MIGILAPVMYQSDLYGWAGWIHWETSGAHFYAWDEPLFFSVDVYTCKAFSAEAAVRFPEEFFAATEIVFKKFCVRLAEPFALAPDEARRLTDDVLASVDGGPGRYSVHVATGHRDGALLGLQVVADVFSDASATRPSC